MATSDTHLPDTIHIDEQGCKADASGQWLLEKEHKSGQHPITSNNSIEVLMCGEDSFNSIAVNLDNALSTVDLICWGFDPGMALVRRDSNPAWDPDKTYGAILRRLTTAGVKVRLMIWYHRVASVKQQSMPGFTDSVLPTLTFEEKRQASERARGNGDAYQSIPLDQRTDKDLRQDHCIEWWRWAMDKRNSGLIEVRHRDGDKYTIRQSFLSEASQPQGHWSGVPVQKILAEDFGTHHQKTVLIDYHHATAKAVGYVMGLNSLTQYWDTSAHDFNDPKRDLDHGGTTDTYKRVKKAGGNVSKVRVDPLHDYVCRIEGEALQFVNDNFCDGWELVGGSTDRAVPVKLAEATFAGSNARLQIVRTFTAPGKPIDKTIKDTYFHASEFARRYLYLETQYFQYKDWTEHLKASRKAYRAGLQDCGGNSSSTPGILHVFIVTPRPELAMMAPDTFDTLKTLGASGQLHEVDLDGNDTGQANKMNAENAALAEWDSDTAAGRVHPPGPKPTRSEVGEAAAKINEPSAKDLKADGLKVLVAMLDCFDGGNSGLKRPGEKFQGDKYRQIYIHSKLMIIDDGFFTLGSANMSQRSMAVDSEINVSTDTPAEVTALRRKVWAAHTDGAYDGDSGSPAEIAETFRNWQTLMSDNDGNKKAGLPLQGFLCSLADYKFSDIRSF